MFKKPVHDNTIKAALKEVADELNIPTTQVDEAFSVCLYLGFAKMRKLVPFLLPNFGTFHMTPRKTHRTIDRMFQSMRNRDSGKDPEGMTREQVKEKLQHYLPLHAIATQHNPRRGVLYLRKLRHLQRQQNAGTPGQEQDRNADQPPQ